MSFFILEFYNNAPKSMRIISALRFKNEWIPNMIKDDQLAIPCHYTNVNTLIDAFKIKISQIDSNRYN